MFKPTQSMLARGRLRLTTKQVNGGYYKGNRTGSMGSFNKRGTYMPDLAKHRVYMAPVEPEVYLFPFVTKHMRRTPSNYVQDLERDGRKSTVIRAFQGSDYLEMWASTAEAEEARKTEPRPEKTVPAPTSEVDETSDAIEASETTETQEAGETIEQQAPSTEQWRTRSQQKEETRK